MRSQFATSKLGRGQHRKYAPYLFAERGAIVAATILNGPSAEEMSVYIVCALVKLRELLAANVELAKRLDELEARITRKLATHDQANTEIIKTIRQLMTQPEPKKRPIGFVELQEKKAK